MNLAACRAASCAFGALLAAAGGTTAWHDGTEPAANEVVFVRHSPDGLDVVVARRLDPTTTSSLLWWVPATASAAEATLTDARGRDRSLPLEAAGTRSGEDERGALWNVSIAAFNATIGNPPDMRLAVSFRLPGASAYTHRVAEPVDAARFFAEPVHGAAARIAGAPSFLLHKVADRARLYATPASAHLSLSAGDEVELSFAPDAGAGVHAGVALLGVAVGAGGALAVGCGRRGR